MELRHDGYKSICLTKEPSGMEEAGGCFCSDITDLPKALAWFAHQGTGLFRVSATFMPFRSRSGVNWETRFAAELEAVREVIEREGLRLCMLPGANIPLNSPDEEEVSALIADIEWLSRLVHWMDPKEGIVQVPLSGEYEGRVAALTRFAQNFARLTPQAQHYLAVQNDDGAFQLDDVLPLCRHLKVPIIFDYLYQQSDFYGETWELDFLPRLDQALQTWHRRRVPIVCLLSRDYRQRELDEMLAWLARIRPEEEFDLMIG